MIAIVTKNHDSELELRLSKYSHQMYIASHKGEELNSKSEWQVEQPE